MYSRLIFFSLSIQAETLFRLLVVPGHYANVGPDRSAWAEYDFDAASSSFVLHFNSQSFPAHVYVFDPDARRLRAAASIYAYDFIFSTDFARIESGTCLDNHTGRVVAHYEQLNFQRVRH